jgi:hypothetical protein
MRLARRTEPDGAGTEAVLSPAERLRIGPFQQEVELGAVVPVLWNRQAHGHERLLDAEAAQVTPAQDGAERVAAHVPRDGSESRRGLRAEPAVGRLG